MDRGLDLRSRHCRKEKTTFKKFQTCFSLFAVFLESEN